MVKLALVGALINFNTSAVYIISMLAVDDYSISEAEISKNIERITKAMDYLVSSAPDLFTHYS